MRGAVPHVHVADSVFQQADSDGDLIRIGSTKMLPASVS